MSSGSRSFHYAWVILVVGTAAVFGCLGLARFGYTVVLPPMQKGLGLDNTAAGFLATSNLLGYAALSVLGGALASRLGPRVVIAAGLLVAAAGMLLTAFAQDLASAATFRLLTGIGSGLSNVPVMALLAAWFTSRRRGLATGVVATGSSPGLIVVGSLVPRYLEGAGPDGWRDVWLMYAVATLFLAVAAYLLLRNRPADKGLLPLGAQSTGEGGRREAAGSRGTGMPGAGASGGLEWGRVYRSSAVYHLGAVYVAFGFAYFIYLTFFTKYLTTTGGYTATSAGNLLMTIGWVSLVCGVIWGTVSDVIGRRAALIIVYLIQAVAFSLFGLWQSPLGFTISAVLFGLTAWSIPAIMAATCGDVLGPRLAPAALGFITLFFALGQALGPSVAGVIADATGSFAPAFVLAGAVALLGAGGAALLRPSSTEEAAPRVAVGESA